MVALPPVVIAESDDGNPVQFNEIVALLRRNEGDERNSRDVDDDLQRLLLFSRDRGQRDALVQAQAVRRLVLIARHATSASTHRYCAAILCNIALSERGRLSASSCDRWLCVSHRHQCPFFVLLSNTQTSTDMALRHLSAAALLSFSVQTEAQLQLEQVGALPVLLRLLAPGDADGELAVFAAAVLWNLAKSPLLLLKLETTHGQLKEQLARRLTALLWTPLASFALAVRATGERGTTGVLDPDGDNLGVMLAATLITHLTIALCVENYVGRARALSDQFRVKTPTRMRRRQSLDGGSATGTDPGAAEGNSVAHFDESGALVARTCAVCGKSIKMNRMSSSKKSKLRFLACHAEGCEQTYHVACSRWRALEDKTRESARAQFHCGTCVLALPVVHYCDFLAAHVGHARLLTEARFPSVGVKRVPSQQQQSHLQNTTSMPTPPAFTALLDKAHGVVGVGVKRFRVAGSSQDPETFIVDVRYALVGFSPATQQRATTSTSSILQQQQHATSVPPVGDWSLSYAHDNAMQIPVSPGNALFWPGPHCRDLDATRYTHRALVELENAYVYEFQGQQPQDKTFAIGPPSSSGNATEMRGLWSTLLPRKGACVKLLAEQVGELRCVAELAGDARTLSSTPLHEEPTGCTPTTLKKRTKPHFGGKKLSRVAVCATTVASSSPS